MSGIVEFGDDLLRTGDLDPVYVAVAGAQLDRATLCRLSLAYWCFYNLGAAAKMAEIRQPKKYWAKMMEAAAFSPLGDYQPNGGLGWPRGSERRHFRGAQAIQSVAELVMKYRTAEEAVEGLMGVGPKSRQQEGVTHGYPTYNSVATAAQSHRGFGPWIAFKIADWSERVLGYGTDFTDCHLGIYKDPRQGAAVALAEWKDFVHTSSAWSGAYSAAPWDYPISDRQLEETVDHYVERWQRRRSSAPPFYDRLVNVQEIETIFCKYKSHLKGHYPMGKDTQENLHTLYTWGAESGLAQQLYVALHEGVRK